MKIKTIKTKEDFFDDFMNDIMSNACNPMRNTVYRGQSDASWGLVANVYRPTTFEKWKYDQPRYWIDSTTPKEQPKNSHGHANEEGRLLRKFVASLHDSNYAIPETPLSRTPRGTQSLLEFSLREGETFPIPDYVDLMAIAQHYKIPTRMLDWTRNYLIGLFFGILGNKYNNDFAIFSLDVEPLLFHLHPNSAYNSNSQQFNQEAHRAIMTGFGLINVAHPSPHLCPNIHAQQGVLIYISEAVDKHRQAPHDLIDYVEKLPKYLDDGMKLLVNDFIPDEGGYQDIKNCLTKYVFSAKIINFVSEWLIAHNIHHGTVFPDLNGIAEYSMYRDKRFNPE